MLKQFALAGCLAFAAATQAQAAVQTYDFTATIYTVNLVPNGWAGPQLPSSVGPDGVNLVKAGDVIAGRFSFDTSVVPSVRSPWDFTVYEYSSGATFSYTFLSGGYTVGGTSSGLSVWDYASDSLADDELVLWGPDDDGQLRFSAASDSLFSAGLPARGLSLDSLSSATMNNAWWRADGELISFNANLTSLTLVPAPVPEPATFGMMLAGLGVLGFAAGRARRNHAATRD